LKHTEDFRKVLATPSGGWSVKGFIDVAKNIGSCVKISELKEGTGPFSRLGVKIFDDFWMHYMNAEMSRNAKLRKPPYTNLEKYIKYRNIKNV
jgi:hypothetical protein